MEEHYMKTTVMKVEELVHPEKNVRVHTENQVNELIKSIKKFGQIRPVVVDENNIIMAGNGLVEALNKMGADTATVLKMQDLSDNDKKKLMIADNKIYSLGYDDNDSIYEILQSLDGDFDVPGYEEDLLKELMLDEDEVDEMIGSYGVINDDQRGAFERAGESIERKTEAAIQQPETIQTASGDNSTAPTSYDQVGDHDTKETTDVQKYVECPHCGEKVWL